MNRAIPSTLHDRLEEIFQLVFGDDELELCDGTTAADVQGWDSVAHVNLMFSIEEAFGIRFNGNEFAQLENIGELKRLLEQRSASRPAA